MIGSAKDPFREDRYDAIYERLRLDHYLKLPNLDRVLPLPPAPLPHWNSDPDTLINAAKGVRITPKPATTSAHQLPPNHRAHIPPGHMLHVPAGESSLTHRTWPGFGPLPSEIGYRVGVARAPFDGYWQARPLPAQPHDQPYTRHLRQAFSEMLPMRFREGERMQLTVDPVPPKWRPGLKVKVTWNTYAPGASEPTRHEKTTTILPYDRVGSVYVHLIRCVSL